MTPALARDDARIWDAYHELLLGPDVERLRKLLVRYDVLRIALEVPGDVVECGVFKGTGVMTWLKLLSIYAPGSSRRVVGFDTFDAFARATDAGDASTVAAFVRESGHAGTDPAALVQAAIAAGLDASALELVAGDIRTSAADYVRGNPGFRIALLHMDLDLGEPTFFALQSLWPRVVRGGVVVLDEYAIPRWSESDGVDRFLESTGLRLRALPHARTPTAILVKD
ncbi:MAG TPA: TylF/MycF/NovP-related O-methyltransferase [Nannocystaceae bacterium]|nr:TylF/MycF/NovP-related O-methyltransferase [Nannocystaceae bacterium]